MRTGPTLALGILLCHAVAHAQECPSLEDADAVVDAASAKERRDYLMSTLPRARRNARRWFWSWTGTFGALTAGQLAAIPFLDDEAQRRGFWVNSASSAVGALFLVVAPPPAMRLQRLVERRGALDGDPCEALAMLEAEMVAASRAERFGKSWLTHGGNLLLNSGAGLVLALGWNDWGNAWATTTIGTAVGEVMIWTQPMGVSRALERYRIGTWRGASTSPRASLAIHPLSVPHGAGFGVTVSF